MNDLSQYMEHMLLFEKYKNRPIPKNKSQMTEVITLGYKYNNFGKKNSYINPHFKK